MSNVSISRLFVHAVGGPAWSGVGRKRGTTTAGHIFLCGAGAETSLAEAVDNAVAGLPVLVIPQQVWGSMKSRYGLLEKAVEDLEQRARDVNALLKKAVPFIPLIVLPCARCLVNLRAMRVADDAKLAQSGAAFFGLPAEVMGKFSQADRDRESARGARNVARDGRVERPDAQVGWSDPSKPVDPRQARADARWGAAEAAAAAKSKGKPKTKAKSKAESQRAT